MRCSAESLAPTAPLLPAGRAPGAWAMHGRTVFRRGPRTTGRYTAPPGSQLDINVKQERAGAQKVAHEKNERSRCASGRSCHEVPPLIFMISSLLVVRVKGDLGGLLRVVDVLEVCAICGWAAAEQAVRRDRIAGRCRRERAALQSVGKLMCSPHAVQTQIQGAGRRTHTACSPSSSQWCQT